MKYQAQPYYHSYMLLPEGLNISQLSQYKEVQLSGFKLVHSESMYCLVVNEGADLLIALGYMLDIRDGKKSMETILNELITTTDIVSALEYINGRYVLISERNKVVSFYSDASNLLPANYHEASNCISSHDKLLAEVLSDNHFEITERPLKKTNDLDFTRFNEVWKMNPSLKYSLDPFTKTRIYPRETQVKQSVDEAFQTMKPYFEEMNVWLKDFQGDMFLSLTAGMDSRTSAAIIHPLATRIEFLTYQTPNKFLATSMAKKIYKIDTEVVQDMVSNMGWNHTMVNLGDYEVPEESMAYFKETLNSKHSHRLAQYYRDKGYDKALHIKSTIFGVGKGDYDKSLDSITDTLNDYKKLMTHFQKDFKAYYDISAELDAYFNRNLVMDNVTKGRHYFELYHLESRLGNWHSVLTSETDPETDEFIYLNTRKMIDLFTSVSISDMRKHRLHKRIIESYWAVLNYFGVNQTSTLWDDMKKRDGHSFLFNQLQVRYPADMHVERESDALLIYPNPISVSAFDSYSVILQPTENTDIKFLVQSMYKKKSGRGNVFVTIKGECLYERFDVLDMNGGIEVIVEDTPIKITIEYIKSFNSDSWKHAGKLLLRPLE